MSETSSGETTLTTTKISPEQRKAQEALAKFQLSPPLWWCREIVAVAAWTFAAVKVFAFDVDIYLLERFAPSYLEILNYKFFILIGLIAASWLALGKEKFRIFVAYVLIYPLVALLWKIPKHLCKNWPLAIAFAPAVFDLVSALRTVFVFYAVATISCLFIARSNNRAVLICAMALLGAFLVFHLTRSFLKAYKAGIFSGLTRLARKLRAKLEKEAGTSFWKKVDVDDTKEKRDAYIGQLTGIYLFNTLFAVVADKLQEVARSRKLDLYMYACWAFTVVVSVTVFAFEYVALSKLEPLAFTNTESAGFFSYLGYSFGVLTRIQVSAIKPISTHAQLLAICEGICGLFVMVILVSSLFSVFRDKNRDDFAEFQKEMQQFSVYGETVINALYGLTLFQVEVLLLAQENNMVNPLRKLRGMPEISAGPTTDTTPPEIEPTGQDVPKRGNEDERNAE